MRWTCWAGIAAMVLGLAGCAYGYRSTARTARYSAGTRPDASYYCYDCHGYRFFDPYYDFCASHGFQYRWSRHPRVIALYRDRYVGIKEDHPDYGRYRYREGYRDDRRYQEPRDYEVWRRGVNGQPGSSGASDRKRKNREKRGGEPGKTKDKKGDERKGPRDIGSRPTLPGGMS